MKDQSQCAMTTSISQNRVRLNETKFSPELAIFSSPLRLFCEKMGVKPNCIISRNKIARAQKCRKKCEWTLIDTRFNKNVCGYFEQCCELFHFSSS